MSVMTYEQIKRPYLTTGTVILLILMGLGFLAALQRYFYGLGAATHLNDQYPWGIWIAFDVLCGVALAAGGFITAAVVYVFGRKKYHSLLRPAVLTAFLGYTFVAIALLVDLGLPWHIWRPIVNWPPHSAMFEVAWCVMLYLSVLALEFLPAVFERFGWQTMAAWWPKLVTPYCIVALSFFTYIMSHSLIWAAAALVVLTVLTLILPNAVRASVPILLIIAGILFSTAHQSSLGSLFLLMPNKLSALWWSPMLPVNFLLTAVAVGFAMVIFEATLAAKAFNRPVEKEPLAGMGLAAAWVLWIYLVVRIIDVAIQGGLSLLGSGRGAAFIVELLLGIVIPAIMLSSVKLRHNTWQLFTASALVVFGVIFNRFNVTLTGMDKTVFGQALGYFPSVQELLITLGIIAAVIFCYNILVKSLPVFERHSSAHE